MSAESESRELLGDILAVRPAAMTPAAAARETARLFGVEGALVPLRSERDQNFRVDTASGATFILKLSHPAEDARATALQSAVLRHLAAVDPALPVPRVVPTLDGGSEGMMQVPGEAPRIVRLLTFLPGTLLHEIAAGTELLFALGAAAGRLDRALQGLESDARQQDLLWNMAQFQRLEPMLEQLAGDPIHDPIAATFADYRSLAMPALGRLRRGFIHNDLNPHNVLVNGDTPRVTGILDFGDMVHGPLVWEAAIAAAYHVGEGADPLGGVAACIAGYHSALPLTGEEVALLPVFIAARLAMSVLITDWRARREPDNAAYILRNNPASRRGLARLAEIGREAAAEIIARRCGRALAA